MSEAYAIQTESYQWHPFVAMLDFTRERTAWTFTAVYVSVLVAVAGFVAWRNSQLGSTLIVGIVGTVVATALLAYAYLVMRRAWLNFKNEETGWRITWPHIAMFDSESLTVAYSQDLGEIMTWDDCEFTKLDKENFIFQGTVRTISAFEVRTAEETALDPDDNPTAAVSSNSQGQIIVPRKSILSIEDENRLIDFLIKRNLIKSNIPRRSSW